MAAPASQRIPRARRHITADGAPPRRNPNPPPRPRVRLCGACGTDQQVHDLGGSPPKLRCSRCTRAEVARGLPESAKSTATDPFSRMEDT